MTKEDISNKISVRTKIPASHIEKVLSAFVDVVTEEVAKGGQVRLMYFGTLKQKYYKQKRRYFFGKNKIITAPSKTKPIFEPSPTFLKKVMDNHIPRE